MEITVYSPWVVVATPLGSIIRLDRDSGMVKSANSSVFVMELLEMFTAHHHLAGKRKSAMCWMANMAAILVHKHVALLQETLITCRLIEPSLTSRAHAAMC